MLYQNVRPKTLDELVGNRPAKVALRAWMESSHEKRSRVLLFTGPSGCGKTTLARIAAGAVNAEVEPVSLNAAALTGGKLRDTVRKMTQFGMLSAPLVIVEEFDRISGQNQRALTDALEDESRITFALCGVELNDIDGSVQTRSLPIRVGPLNEKSMRGLLARVIDEQDCVEPGEDVLRRLVVRAGGSPRTALQLLEAVQGMDRDDALAYLTDAPTSQTEALDRYRELGAMIGRTEKDRFRLMMEWRLWEVEGIKAESMFNRDFCRQRDTFYRWKRELGFTDPRKSQRIKDGIQRKTAKDENKEYDFHTSPSGSNPVEPIEPREGLRADSPAASASEPVGMSAVRELLDLTDDEALALAQNARGSLMLGRLARRVGLWIRRSIKADEKAA